MTGPKIYTSNPNSPFADWLRDKFGKDAVVQRVTKADLAKLDDRQLRALSDDEFWGAIEPDGLCPRCDDPKLVAEAKRRRFRDH